MALLHASIYLSFFALFLDIYHLLGFPPLQEGQPEQPWDDMEEWSFGVLEKWRERGGI